MWKKHSVRLIVYGSMALIALVPLAVWLYFVSPLHIVRVEWKLRALSFNQAKVQQRLQATRLHGDWDGGNIAVAKDGYIFYYDCHDSHGLDNIPDINIFYLPDERRFIINRHHFCSGLGEDRSKQPEDKAGVLAIALGGDR
jgi:hypothetical protein